MALQWQFDFWDIPQSWLKIFNIIDNENLDDNND